MTSDNNTSRTPGWRAFVAYLGLVLIFGLALIFKGGQLLLAGGTAYYVLAGIGLVISAVLLSMRKVLGFWTYTLVALGTLAWAIAESGSNGWGYIPRLGWLIFLSVVLLGFFSVVCKQLPDIPKKAYLTVCGFLPVAMLAMILIPITWPASIKLADPSIAADRPADAYSRRTVNVPDGNVAGSHDESNWTSYAGSNLSNHYSPASLINKTNVAQLELAWDYRHGDNKPAGSKVMYRNEGVPLKIGDSLYLCTPNQTIVSVNATTGAENWRFDSKVGADYLHGIGAVCRGVAYYEIPQTKVGAANEAAGALSASACRKRILWGTADLRMGAVDAETGKPCADFGTNGFKDLSIGMGRFRPGSVGISSAPIVLRDTIIVGNLVIDSDVRPAPSGVIRGFDPVTGKLRWAWDLGRPANDQILHAEPEQASTYTLSTPNSWSPMSADDELGLVYVALGNPAGDFYGGERTPEEEKYGSALVALDASSGKERWHFQTVHHDLWDYDLSPQPNLVDFAGPDGKKRPAVIQATKSGHIYVLDRATGEPLAPITEVPVPQGTVAGDHTAPTQPLTLDFPNVVGEPGKRIEVLTEASTWGLTPFDQIGCRLDFRKARYDGIFTPPVVGQESIVYPGHHGGINWGGVMVDPDRGLMMVNTQRLPYLQKSVARDDLDKLGVKSFQQEPGMTKGYRPQQGQPVGATKTPWLSAINQPCIAPPWGYLAAIDLRKQDVIWSRPFGTGYDSGPLGIASHTKFQIGTPSDSTGLATAGGITVIGAALDQFIRAFDSESGALLWEQRLPAGNQAAPITYVADGKQYIVAVVGGHDLIPTKAGDHVMAWTLPAKK